MKPSKLFITAILGASLTLGPVAFATEHDEANIDNSKVPAAVQQAAAKEAKGGKIVRWEKEGNRYEAVIDKNGKQWGYAFDGNGKLLNKHDESKEKGEKH